MSFLDRQPAKLFRHLEKELEQKGLYLSLGFPVLSILKFILPGFFYPSHLTYSQH